MSGRTGKKLLKGHLSKPIDRLASYPYLHSKFCRLLINALSAGGFAFRLAMKAEA